MSRCPKCRRKGVLRVAVSLFLDIPGELAHGLSKRALRAKAVRVMGADWPRSTTYCGRCGWMAKIG